MPPELNHLLESREETREMKVECVTPEHPINFDSLHGEPRNADLAFIGETPLGKVAVTIEAKADEPFGDTVAGTLAAALERLVENPRSQGVRRVESLVRSLFAVAGKGLPMIASLRYQLLTAAAGTLAYALQQCASLAILVVHEFVTDKTSDKRQQKNAADFNAFLTRLAGTAALQAYQSGLLGPFVVPGLPLFEKAPRFLVGEIRTPR
jgi:hypothetical protein